MTRKRLTAKCNINNAIKAAMINISMLYPRFINYASSDAALCRCNYSYDSHNSFRYRDGNVAASEAFLSSTTEITV